MEFTGERFMPGKEIDQELVIEHLQRYQMIKEYVKDKVVVDAACGEGYGSYMLAEVAKQVTGIDINKEAVLEATEKYKKNNLIFLEGSIAQLPFLDNSIDVFVSLETIEHVDEEVQEAFLKEVKRVLKKDGLLIISTPNKKIYSDEFNYTNEFHIREFYKEEFIEFINKYFKHYKLYSQYKEITYCITSEETSYLAQDGKYSEDYAKYYICIASNEAISQNNTSVITIAENLQYIPTMHRILSLQEEVEERNQHIFKLDKEIEGKDYRVVELQKEVDEKNHRVVELQKEVDEKNYQAIELQKQIEGRDNQIIELRKEIEKVNEDLQISNKQIIQKEEILKSIQLKVQEQENRLGENRKTEEEKDNEIQALMLQVEEYKRELEKIHISTGWKGLVSLYKLRDNIFPENSRRRLIVQLLKKVLSNPSFYIKNINKNNIMKLRHYMACESPEQITNRFNNLESRQDNVQDKSVEVLVDVDCSHEIVFNYEENPQVSIIIPVYNQYKYTYYCLKSILENTEGITYEVIIADDVSTDETINISKYVKNIKVIRNKTNLGFLLNCNNAAKVARGKYIHFLNNDTQVQKGWLSSLVELIERDATIGMVGSQLIYPNGQLQEAGGILWKDGSAWNYGRNGDPEASEFNYVKEVDYISGASIMLPKWLWDEIGGFDKRYIPAYCEDSDLAFEVRRKGYKVMYQPLSRIIHFEGISNGTDTNTGLKAYQVTNSGKFYDKWKEILEKEHFPNAENVFVARDRRQQRKTILVIDHYVPHYDKDAGSRTVYQYLKLFVEKGYNVKFIGDNFCRHEPYTTTLQQLGIEVLYGPYYAQNYKQWIKNNSKYIDYVFCNRPHISEKYVDFLIKNTKAKIIYYGHDLHFLREMREYELNRNPKSLELSDYWKDKEIALMKKVDVVYYPSQVEVDIIKEIDTNINAKAIPAYIFNKDKEAIAYDIQKRSGVMFIGGFGHKPNVDAVIWYVNEILPHVLKINPTIKTYILGSNPPKEIKELESENVIIKGFVTDEELEQFYNMCRISIVPLRYGAGIKGKVVEGMYNQIPIITTSVGAEGILQSDESLVVEDDALKYAEKLVELYEDETKLKKLSGEALNYVKNNFTLDKVIEVIGDDFDFIS